MVSKKIAFLCLAHNNFDYLAKLSNYYSSENDGFFLHVDSSININNYKSLANLAEGSVILSGNERYRTSWGSFNIVLATISLIKKALATGLYDRFILVSGVDLPLLTKQELKVRLTLDLNYFCIWQMVNKDKPHMLSREFFKRHYYDYKLTNPGLAYLTGKRMNIYRVLFLNRCLASIPLSQKQFTFTSYMKGSQWWSITKEMAEYFVDALSKPEVIDQFKLMHAPDEKMFQTLAYDSPYKDKLSIDHGQDSLKQGLHYIDWGYQEANVTLQQFTLSNVNKAKQLGCAFARKFLDGDTSSFNEHLERLLNN